MAGEANFTEDENHKLFGEFICSAATGEVHGELILLSAINAFLSIAAFLGNTLILVALHKESSLHPPSKLLYRNLAITDLCVGIIAEPLRVAYWIFLVKEKWNICYYANLTSFFSALLLCVASLFTVTALSVDRLLALILGLRYRLVVTLRRVQTIVVVMWILSIVGTSVWFWNPRVSSRLFDTVFLVCFFTSIFSYTKILITLHHNQNQVHDQISQGQPSHTIPLNTARYRKAVYSALWVQVALGVCYLPSFITKVLASRRGMPLSVWLARQFTATLVYLNSSLNPLLYGWKMKEVRQPVKETFRKFFRLSS